MDSGRRDSSTTGRPPVAMDSGNSRGTTSSWTAWTSAFEPSQKVSRWIVRVAADGRAVLSVSSVFSVFSVSSIVRVKRSESRMWAGLSMMWPVQEMKGTAVR